MSDGLGPLVHSVAPRVEVAEHGRRAAALPGPHTMTGIAVPVSVLAASNDALYGAVRRIG
jgi:hypothetical protein